MAKYTIVEGLDLSDFDQAMIKRTGEELLEERAAVEDMLTVDVETGNTKPNSTRERSKCTLTIESPV